MTSNRSPIPVPERCVCEKPITVESDRWYPETQSHSCGMLVGPTCTKPNGTFAPTKTWPWPPVPIFGSTKRVKSLSAAGCEGEQAAARSRAAAGKKLYVRFIVKRYLSFFNSNFSRPPPSSSSCERRYLPSGLPPSVMRPM